VRAVLEHTAPPPGGPATGLKNLFFFDAYTGFARVFQMEHAPIMG
jgi:hypothetical protein